MKKVYIHIVITNYGHICHQIVALYKTLLVKNNYLEILMLTQINVPMKTIVLKDPTTSNGSVLQVRSIFLLVNTLNYVEGNQDELVERFRQRWLGLFMQ